MSPGYCTEDMYRASVLDGILQGIVEDENWREAEHYNIMRYCVELSVLLFSNFFL